ncbi:MAG TPA: hypothetical protein VD770_01375 [Coxiellaceae bacterium]|nr:hypothetical protein [Coxiellaceae bacterium]
MSLRNTIIKASFRECPISDRKNFKQSHCLLPISVGQPIHEASKFLATIRLINSAFQKCTILVDDTVQRHTLKIYNPNDSNAELYQKALLEGDLWLARNKSALKMLNIPHDIMRWDQWYAHSKFNAQLAQIENLYETSEVYRDAINLNIKDYLERQINRDFNYDYAFLCCLDYLKEECAVMTLWTEGSYDFEVYPHGRNKAMAATYEYLIQPLHPALLRSVALRFKKHPAPLTPFPELSNLVSARLHAEC